MIRIVNDYKEDFANYLAWNFGILVVVVVLFLIMVLK